MGSAVLPTGARGEAQAFLFGVIIKELLKGGPLGRTSHFSKALHLLLTNHPTKQMGQILLPLLHRCV